MEIENEGKVAIMDSIEDEYNGEQQKKSRGRRKKQNQGWEETIDVILPKIITSKIQQSASQDQKGGKKRKQSEQMEIEEYGSGSANYKDKINQITNRGGNFGTIFNLNEHYNLTIEAARFEIQRENFQHLIQRVINIIQQKMSEIPNFLNYIQLLIEKSHLDLLIDFNKQLEYDISLINEEQSQTIHKISYQGSNLLFKILTHFKNEIQDLIDVIPKKPKKNQKPDIILCLFDGAYNISKQDMIDIGKFFQEEYEQFQDRFQIVILFPISQLISVPDIQIYTIEFCKSKDLFVKFLLFLLKSEEYPPLPQDLLKRMLNEFDLYQITYNEQVRRIKLALSTFLYEHEKNDELIQLLYQMKEYAQQLLTGCEEENENKDIEDEEEVDQKPKGKRKRGRSSKKNNSQKQTKMQQNHQNILIGKLDLWMKKKEIKAIVCFLENLFKSNFANGNSNEGNSFQQGIIDQNYRIVEIVLNKDKRYIMPPNQQKDFLKDPNEACNIIISLLSEIDEGFEDHNVFKSSIRQLQNIDDKINEDLERLKKVTISSNDRYAKSQQLKKVQQTNSANKSVMKKERVEDIIKHITTSLHEAFNQMNISKLAISTTQLNAQCRPDMLGSIMTHLQMNEPVANVTKKKQNCEVVRNNSDGINLLHLIQQYGKKFQIGECFGEYISFLREYNPERDAETNQASFYNAICELRYLGLIEEKRKLKNEFIKHFFAKSSYMPMSVENS